MSEPIDVIRLKRTDLYSSNYQLWFIESLFAKGRVDNRLRYAGWLFGENPCLKKDDDLPIYICKVNGNDAGQIAIIAEGIVERGYEAMPADHPIKISRPFQGLERKPKILETQNVDGEIFRHSILTNSGRTIFLVD